jgi:DNA-binding beta-propeller fold protein YncE
VLRRPLCTAAAVAVLLPLALTSSTGTGWAGPPDRLLSPVATFEVSGEVAEILAATPDGRTVLYTDSEAQEVGFVDLTRPEAPRQLGAVPVDGEPTSVAVTRDGRYALVTVDTSTSFTSPSGVLLVLDVRTRSVLATIQLGGQPDSIALSPDGRYAAVAVENQRDEDLADGFPPQLPAGFLSVVELTGRPATWTADAVALTGLPGLAYPDDPEPEYVDIRDGIAAVTLQENNAVALVDLRTRTVLRSFSAGAVVRTDADTADDGVIAFDDALTAPREPDAVQWTPDGNLVTADEGDLTGGGRGFTIFTPTGAVLYASGASAEQALAAEGRYPDGRSDNKGAEFEGAEVARLRGQDLLFIGSERGDAVLVYDLADESAPRLLQVLPTGDSPEGLLAITRQGLLLTSNEGDGTISVFSLRAQVS